MIDSKATSQVIYIGELRTEATHLRSSSSINTDAPLDNNGLGRTFSPTDLLATSLASCMLTMMGIRANESNLNIEGTRALMTKIMNSNPRRVSEIRVEIDVVNRNLTNIHKTVLEKTARECPVALSLSESLKQVVSFNYVEK